VLLQRFAAIIPFLIVGPTLLAQTTSNACPPVKAKNAQEALTMEGASNKEGCWVRDPNTGQLVFVNMGGIKYKPVLPQPNPAALSNGIKVRYVAGETGIEVLSPWSLRGSGPGWSVAVFKDCSSSPLEYQTSYGTTRKGYLFPGPAETLVRGAEIAEVSPGTHCVLINYEGHGKGTGWIAKTGQYTSSSYLSAYGFKSFNVEVKLGYTAEVSVPMGILTISVVPPSGWGIGCTFTDQEGYNLGIWDTTGLTAALAPGSYSYSCGGSGNDYPGTRNPLAAPQNGTVQISSGKTSTVTLTPRPTPPGR
jgi:hypothetical protein